MFKDLIRILKNNETVDDAISYNLNDICANIIDGIDSQVMKHNELAFERFVDKFNLEDEIAELKEFCSPEELSLFLSDIG